MSFELEVKNALDALESAGILRCPKTVCSAQGPEIVIEDRSAVNLCSNNYLGLTNHPAIVEATIEAIRTYGIGAAGSRHVQGTMDPHKRAEQRFSRLVGLEAALVFSSGYAANIGSIQALAGSSDLIFSDQFNHASIIDGCRLSRARVLVYRHLDIKYLEELMASYRHSAPRALVVTEALFSVDGDVAPLTDLRALCDRHDSALMVDEAHSLGVFGPRGTGLCVSQQVRPDLLIGTLGKAFGVAGAFVAGASPVIKLIENLARSYIFSTATPPCLASAAIAAADIVEAADDRRKKLLGHARKLRQSLIDLGYRVPEGNSPIIPIHIGNPDATMTLCAALIERGVFIHGIRPPTVPPGASRLRATPMATHEDRHIDMAIDAFSALAPKWSRK